MERDERGVVETASSSCQHLRKYLIPGWCMAGTPSYCVLSLLLSCLLGFITTFSLATETKAPREEITQTEDPPPFCAL